MPSQILKWSSLSTLACLAATTVISSPAQAGDPTKTIDGVTYQTISSHPSDGAKVTDYDNTVAHKNVSIRDQIVIDGDTYKVRRIAQYAFNSGNNLAKLTIPTTVKVIGAYAFDGTSLKELKIPDSVTSVGDHTCYGCESLTRLTFGSGVNYIGADSFSGADLEHVTIPKSVTEIGDNAFYNNQRLKYAKFKGAAPTIGGNVFFQPDPNFRLRYYSRFDDSLRPGGFSLGSWMAIPTAMVPEVTVKAMSPAKDNSPVKIRVLVRAGSHKVNFGQVKLRFAGVTKTFKINSPYSTRTFRTPNVHGGSKIYTARADYQGAPADSLLKSTGTKRIKVVE